MSEDHSSSHSYEIRVEGEMSEVFLAAFPEMHSSELDPCVVLVVRTDDHTDAADLALRIRQLGHSVLSVRRRIGRGRPSD